MFSVIRIRASNGKWTASKNDPSSGFLSVLLQQVEGGGGRSGGRQNNGGGGGRRDNHWGKLKCHNYGNLGHIVRNCWMHVAARMTKVQ